MKRASKIIVLIVLMVVALQCSQVKGHANNTTEEPSSWAKQYIDMAVKLELIPVTEELNYKEKITREQFCTYLVHLYEKLSNQSLETKTKMPFTDTNNESVNKAYCKGIIQGTTETLFGPKEFMTREEIMVVMIKTMELLEKELGRNIIIKRDVALDKTQELKDLNNDILEAIKIAIGNDLITENIDEGIQINGTVTVEEVIVLITKMATVAENSKNHYFLEQGNYVVNGSWWHFDNTGNFSQDKTFTNVAEAYKGYVLKKDGTLYINKHKTQPLYKIIEDGSIKMSTWKPYQLKCVTGVYRDNYGDFIVIQLDGSVWICDDYSNRYKSMQFPEPIVDITGDSGVFIALGKSGKVYFYGGAYEDEESNPIFIKISCNQNTYRALDEECNVWEWKKKYEDDGWQISEGIKKTGLTKAELDYYSYYKDYDLTEFKKSHTIVEIDNIHYSGCYIVDDKGDVYFSNNDNQFYEKLQISAKQFKNGTVLDTSGSVWYSSRMPRGGGYRLYGPIPIPGMNKGVLIDDKICLREDGSIWSWEMESWGWNNNITEHIVGYLPEELKASDVNKILQFDTYILMLDNQGRCWFVYTYEKVLEFGLTTIQIAKLLSKDIKDIGHGFVLNNQGQLHWFTIKTNDKEGLERHFIMDNIKQLASDQYNNMVLDNSGVIFYVGSIDDYKNTGNNEIYPNLPFRLNELPVMEKVWNAYPLGFPTGIGMDNDGNVYSICINNLFNDEKNIWENNVIVNPIIINNVKDFYFTWSDIIVQKNNGQSKAWLVYENAYQLFTQNQTIGLEEAFKKINN